MKKIIALCMALLLTMTVFAACAEKENDAEKLQEINISYVKLPLNVPSIIEKEKQLFEEEFGKDGIQVNFPEITQGPKMTEALASGSLDFCNALGGTSAILAAANGVDLKIIGIYSRAPKAFTIMTTNPEIRTIADLKGKSVAGPKGTILHQLLLGALANEGQSINDITFVNMGIPESVSALFSNNVDAALVAGPEVAKAKKSGARILTTGEGILDATIVIAVSGEFLKNHEEMVERYLKVHQESLSFMEENPEETLALAAEETGLSTDDVSTMLPWYDFDPEITANDVEELEKTQDFLIKNDMLGKEIEIQNILLQ